MSMMNRKTSYASYLYRTLFLIIFLALGVTVTLTILITHNIIEKQTNAQFDLIKKLAVTHVENFLDESVRELEAITSGNTANEVINDLKRTKRLSLHFSQFFESIYILDDQGIVQYVSDMENHMTGSDLSNLPVIKKLNKNKRQAWSRLYISNLSYNQVVSYAVSFDNHILVAQLSLEKLRMILKLFETDNGIDFAITNKQAVYILSPLEIDTNTHTFNHFYNLLAEQKSIPGTGSDIFQYKNKQYVVSWSTLSEPEWRILILYEYKNVRHSIFSGILSLFISLIIVNFIFIAAILITVQKVTQPVKDLAENFKQIRSGNYSMSLAKTPILEFSSLLHEFEKMSEAVFSREIDLKKAKQRAENATVLKNQFIANVSHELRNPLNAAMGMTEILSNSKLDKHQKETVNKLQQSNALLMRLIGDLLDFSAMEAGKIKTRKTPFELNYMLKSIYKGFHAQADEKGLEFRCDITQTEGIIINNDELRMNQIVSNLISNAIKYTNKGFIELRTSYKKTGDKKIELTVELEDTGIGFDEKAKRQVFDSFIQLESSYIKSHNGMGLGLSITKDLITLLNGHITVKSEKGSGSLFSVVLPCELTPAIEKKEISTNEEAHMLNGTNVLIAEDEAINRMYLKSQLKLWKINVDEAANGIEVENKLQKKSYDIIIMDIGMPGQSGVETAEKIKKLKLSTAPILALTAHVYPEDIKTYIKTGFNGIVSKPIHKDMLRTALSNVLRGQSVWPDDL